MIIIDIETLGVGARAAIMSIAAIHIDKFVADPITLVPNNQFSVNVDLYSNIAFNREFDADTVKFWSDNKKKLHLFSSDTTTLHNAIVALLQFVDCDEYKDELIYCNPASFDHTIVKTAMRDLNLIPYHHWRERCYRTYINDISSLTGIKYRDIPGVKEYMKVMEEGAHIPINDCIKQSVIMNFVHNHVTRPIANTSI